MKKISLKELRKKVLKVIIDCKGIDNVLNLHLNPLRNIYGTLKVDNVFDYFHYSKQGQAKLNKILKED